MRDLVVHEFGLPPGNLMAYYPEANVLTSTDTDPRSKTPSFKAIAVALEF
jgi:anaerobic selenocysteine-containing dehydrogenase